MCRVVPPLLLAFFALAALPARAPATPLANPSAHLVYFTDDGQATGTPLMPGFLHHSMWSALGAASNGKIYMAVSNHQRPGNSAVFAYDPAVQQMTSLGDLESISTAVNNWMAEESQYKIHSFIPQHADGWLYFASFDHDPTPFLRGAHLYRIDPSNDVVEDYSKTQPYLMTQSLNVITNTQQNAEQSGIFIEYYGIKGIGLHPGRPDLLYAMTYPDGHIIKYDLDTGGMAVIGQSVKISYVFYVDAAGDLYFSDSDEVSQTLFKYDESAGTTTTIATGLADGVIGAIAPAADGSSVYLLLSKSKEVYKLDTATDTVSFLADTCGPNWWRLFNLSLSPDEASLYYVSNNNNRSTIRRIETDTGSCSEVMDIDTLLGSRNLAFGGVGVWDDAGTFYTPVWSSNTQDPPDLALLAAKVEIAPINVPALPAWSGIALLAPLLAVCARTLSAGHWRRRSLASRRSDRGV